ncbi:MAG: hypothetical protein AB8H79_14780 [Myxococcota bacterium]
MRQTIGWIVGFLALALIIGGVLYMQWQVQQDANDLRDRYAEMTPEEVIRDAARRTRKLGYEPAIDPERLIEATRPPPLTEEQRWDFAPEADGLAQPVEFVAPTMTPAPSARRSGLDPTGSIQGEPVMEADIERRTGLRPDALKPVLSAEQMQQVRARQDAEKAHKLSNQRWNDLLLFIGVLLVSAVFIGIGIYVWLVMGKTEEQAEPPPPAADAPRRHATPIDAAAPLDSTPAIAPPMHTSQTLTPPADLSRPPNLTRQPTPASRSPRSPSPRPAGSDGRLTSPQYRSPAPAPRTGLYRNASATPPGARSAGVQQYYTPVGVASTVTSPPPSVVDPAATPTPAISAPGIFTPTPDVPDPTATPDHALRRDVLGPDDATPIQPSFREFTPSYDGDLGDLGEVPKRNLPPLPWANSKKHPPRQ